MAADGMITDLSPGVQTWANAKAEIEEELAALAAPQYLVSASNSLLSAERVATGTSTIAWDFGTAGQAKASVVDGSISYAKLQQVAASSLLGNPTGALATVAAIALGATLAFSGGTLRTAAATGDVTWSANSFVTSIGAGKVTNTMLAGSIAASKLVGTDIATVGTITSGVWNAGAVTSSGTITGNLFSGSGASLTNLPAANLTGTLPAISGANLTALNASNLASGTVPDARFPATLPAASGTNLTNLNASNLASGTVPDACFPATLPAISGANLTALNASNLASGTVGTARLGSGTANNAAFLRGDGVWSNSINGSLTVGGRTDIYSGGLSLIVGADANLTTRTDSVSKVCRVGFPHYLAAEENSAICYCASDASNNTLVFGGGTSLFNAATLIRFQTAADTITTTGSERMRITSAGNVGIGTTGPLNKFDVSGAVAIGSGYAGTYTAPTNGLLVEGNVGIGNTGTLFKLAVTGPSVGTATGTLKLTTPGSAQGERSSIGLYSSFVGTADSGPRRTADIIAGFDTFAWGHEYLAFNVGNNSSPNDTQAVTSEKIRILSSGNVGIGTTGPLNKFDVSGAVAIGSGYAGTYTAPTNGLLVEGNVGIGTTTPNHKLNVNGNIGIATSGYLNFGTTNGTSGYGIRDNAGVMEYKGSGGSWSPIGGGGGGGTVTSVGLSLPAEFSVTASPITTNGSLTAVWATQSANIVFAGPSSGGAAAPAFRSLVVNDLPGSIPASKLVGTDIATVGTITSGIWNAGAVTSSGTITGNLFSGSGASLTNLNASNLSSGTVPTARLGSGTATASKFLRGDQQWIQIAPWIDVKADYGAVGDGTTDDTTAINNAIAAANAATYTPSIYFPPGNYKVTAALTTVTKPVIIRGAGINATTITVSNPNYDVIKFIKGSAGRIVGGGVRDLTITGTGTRSSGYAITVDYFGNFDISDIRITNIYNGIYARQYNDLRIHKTYIGPIYGLYGLRLYGDGSTRNGETDRSDVLNVVNLVIDGNLQNASTEGVRIDGNIHTVQGHSLQVLGCKRGLYVTNTPATTAPSFIIISDYESENCTDECIRVNCAGESFWFNNLYCVGTTGVQVSPGLVYFEGGATDIKLNVGRIAGGYNYGLICDGVDRVDVTDVDVYNNSRQTSNTWDGIYLGNAAAPRFTMKGGMSKGANQRYGLHVVNMSGTRVALAGPDFTGNITAALYDPGSKILAGSFNW